MSLRDEETGLLEILRLLGSTLHYIIIHPAGLNLKYQRPFLPEYHWL